MSEQMETIDEVCNNNHYIWFPNPPFPFVRDADWSKIEKFIPFYLDHFDTKHGVEKLNYRKFLNQKVIILTVILSETDAQSIADVEAWLNKKAKEMFPSYRPFLLWETYNKLIHDADYWH
jgi:hypothetical protein